MIRQLLQKEVQEFIKEHERDNPASLALKYRQVAGVDIKPILEQIHGRQKARAKLPQWYRHEGIVYPSTVSMEQCSSEITARYKAELLQGDTLVDLSGGFGVDTFYFSQRFARVDYIERDPWLYELARHNHGVLGAGVIHHHQDATAFIRDLSMKADAIYVDPARRDMAGKKVFRLEESEPDVVQLLPALLKKANTVLIKTSPLLDIDLTVNSLKFVSAVYVVSVNNDCKEVLYITDPSAVQPRIHTINFLSDGTRQEFSFTREEEKAANIPTGVPDSYLYESNASLMKAGAFNIPGEKYGLKKLHHNTHLYTSDKLKPNFPGRKFEIHNVLHPDRKKIRNYLPEMKANVATRNFPITPEALKKKLGLKDGGDVYLFGITDIQNTKKLLITTKIT